MGSKRSARTCGEQSALLRSARAGSVPELSCCVLERRVFFGIQNGKNRGQKPSCSKRWEQAQRTHLRWARRPSACGRGGRGSSRTARVNYPAMGARNERERELHPGAAWGVYKWRESAYNKGKCKEGKKYLSRPAPERRGHRLQAPSTGGWGNAFRSRRGEIPTRREPLSAKRA